MEGDRLLGNCWTGFGFDSKGDGSHWRSGIRLAFLEGPLGCFLRLERGKVGRSRGRLNPGLIMEAWTQIARM